jgi:hypothetical protein
VELAFSLAATAIADLTRRGQSRLTCAIAGTSHECVSGPATGLFCEELLERLANWPAGHTYSLAAVIEQAIDEAPSGARVLVISSRPADAPSLAAADAELSLDPGDVAWIDVGSAELERLFMLD